MFEPRRGIQELLEIVACIMVNFLKKLSKDYVRTQTWNKRVTRNSSLYYG